MAERENSEQSYILSLLLQMQLACMPDIKIKKKKLSQSRLESDIARKIAYSSIYFLSLSSNWRGALNVAYSTYYMLEHIFGVLDICTRSSEIQRYAVLHLISNIPRSYRYNIQTNMLYASSQKCHLTCVILHLFYVKNEDGRRFYNFAKK